MPRSLAILAVPLVVLAGCGSDDPEPEAAGTDAVTAPPTVTPEAENEPEPEDAPEPEAERDAPIPAICEQLAEHPEIADLISGPRDISVTDEYVVGAPAMASCRVERTAPGDPYQPGTEVVVSVSVLPQTDTAFADFIAAVTPHASDTADITVRGHDALYHGKVRTYVHADDRLVDVQFDGPASGSEPSEELARLAELVVEALDEYGDIEPIRAHDGCAPAGDAAIAALGEVATVEWGTTASGGAPSCYWGGGTYGLTITPVEGDFTMDSWLAMFGNGTEPLDAADRAAYRPERPSQTVFEVNGETYSLLQYGFGGWSPDETRPWSDIAELIDAYSSAL